MSDERKTCTKCGENKPVSEFNLNGHKDRPSRHRSMCKGCEIPSRLGAKRRKLKAAKNIVTTNGGSSSSRQKVRKKTP